MYTLRQIRRVRFSPMSPIRFCLKKLNSNPQFWQDTLIEAMGNGMLKAKTFSEFFPEEAKAEAEAEEEAEAEAEEEEEEEEEEQEQKQKQKRKGPGRSARLGSSSRGKSCLILHCA